MARARTIKNAGMDLFVPAFLVIIFLAGFGCAQQARPIPLLDPGNVARLPLFQKMPQLEHRAPMISIAAVGDLMMSSWIIDVVKEKGVDYPFDSTRALLTGADVAIANLEAPLTADGERFADKKYTFKVPPEFASGIAAAGFDVVNMANNHSVDFGCAGVANTIAALENAGVQHCGAGENRERACAPSFMNINGFRVAFVGFSMTFPKEFWATSDTCGTCYPTEALLHDVISECEQQADLTIVSFHWGAEKHTAPKEYQINFGRRAIDYGADLVLGHHPHVLQGLELYKGKLIAYSLGNFVFASYSNVARTSVILNVKIDDGGLVLARLAPINVHNAVVEFQPTFLRGRAKAAVLDSLRAMSLPLNQGRNIIDDDGFILPSRIFPTPASSAAK